LAFVERKKVGGSSGQAAFVLILAKVTICLAKSRGEAVLSEVCVISHCETGQAYTHAKAIENC
jgi:hypothetical protein